MVSSCYVHNTISVLLADVLQTSSDAALEESPTPVTALYAVMLPRRLVPADQTEDFRFPILLPRVLKKNQKPRENLFCPTVSFPIIYHHLQLQIIFLREKMRKILQVWLSMHLSLSLRNKSLSKSQEKILQKYYNI